MNILFYQTNETEGHLVQKKYMEGSHIKIIYQTIYRAWCWILGNAIEGVTSIQLKIIYTTNEVIFTLLMV